MVIDLNIPQLKAANKRLNLSDSRLGGCHSLP